MIRHASTCLIVVLALRVMPAAPAEELFTVTIDQAAWAKWGLQYPATYVFRVEAAQPQWEVRWRDHDSHGWQPLPKKTSDDFYNGIQCARLDPRAGKLFVSVGFHAGPRFELAIRGFRKSTFESKARYYDGRKAAYTLSLDNWGCNPWSNPGAAWRGTTDDASDCYQAAVHVCRGFRLPVAVAINSRSAGKDATWKLMQAELDRDAPTWEPAVHGCTHPKNRAAYLIHGYREEILGCRADVLARLHNIPYGGRVVEHILTHGYMDDTIAEVDAREFLFVRGFNWLDNPQSADFAPWNARHRFYGPGGLNTMGYDRWLEKREPKARFFAADVAALNGAFDRVVSDGGVFYALWHPDRFQNSIIYDPRPGIDGRQGSTLIEHLRYLSGRKDVWYAANGWLYAYHYVADNAQVAGPGTACSQGGCRLR